MRLVVFDSDILQTLSFVKRLALLASIKLRKQNQLLFLLNLLLFWSWYINEIFFVSHDANMPAFYGATSYCHL